MNYYRQKNYSDQLGTCNTTIANAGCFVCSLAMMSGKTPPEVNIILKNNGGYYKGCMMNSAKASGLLGLQYDGKTQNKPNFTCIAETNHYAPSYPQHFFVLFPDGKINCPIKGERINNPYHIVSYRLFHERSNMGKVVWNDIEVIFTDGQVREMSRDILQKERGATGNESWGFVQECETYARNKYAEFKVDKQNLIKGSQDKVTEINLLKKKNEAQLGEYNKQVIKNNELIEMDKNLRDEIVDLRLELSECKAKLAEKPTGEQPCTFIEWIKQLFNRKD